jgi:hypothetical protein
MGTLIAWFTGSRLSAMLASPVGQRFALAIGKWAAIALAISLFLMSLRRSGERAGRLVERLENQEKANEIQRRMLEAAARRPRNRDELAQRLRGGEF